MRDYLAARELGVIGAAQGVQCTPAAAHRLLASIVGNKAPALFSHSLHVDVGIFFSSLLCDSCGCSVVSKNPVFDRLLAVEDWTQIVKPSGPKLSQRQRADTYGQRTAASISSSAAYRPHGKCHWSIYRGSLLETAVYRPMGNPWSFIQRRLLREPFHTAEPENTEVSRDGRRGPRFHVPGVLIASQQEPYYSYAVLISRVYPTPCVYCFQRGFGCENIQLGSGFISNSKHEILFHYFFLKPLSVFLTSVNTHSLGIKETFQM